MHPLVGDLASLKDNEVENRINDLSRKYFMTPNPLLREQIVLTLNTYKEELAKRRAKEFEKMMANQGKDIDKLINVN
jgi:hypothetical protein